MHRLSLESGLSNEALPAYGVWGYPMKALPAYGVWGYPMNALPAWQISPRNKSLMGSRIANESLKMPTLGIS